MDDTLKHAKEKTDECQADLTDELDSYTLSRFRPSAASRVSGRFLATNRKVFHRKQMRLIVNEYFNKEEDDAEPLSQQAPFPSQTLARTLDEYRQLFKKKTDNFKAALIYELNTYFQSRFRSSATGRGAQFFANQQSFHRQQMLLLIDEFFGSEEDDLPTFPSTAVVTQLDVTSNQESAQVVTSSASPSISPVTPSDQQQLVNSGEVQVKEKPIDKDSSTQPRDVDNPNAIENIIIVSITEQEQSDCEADSDCGCDDCMADKGRIPANSVLISPECDNSEALPNDANEELSTAGNGCEMTNNQDIDEANNSLLNQENNQVEESVAQMQTDAQQQANTVPTSVNSNHGQVDNSVNNSVNSNFENLNESQAMDLSDDVAIDVQADAEPIIDGAFPNLDFVSRTSTSIGRRSTRSKKIVNYAAPVEDSDDEYSTVNHNRKRAIPLAGELSTHKRVAVEPVVVADVEDEDEEEEEENVEEEVGVEAVPLSVIMHHLTCPEAGCTEEYPDKAQLNGHLLSKHQINELRCKVRDCGLSFATQNQLTDHRKLVHRHLKNLPCAWCETICKSYKKLANHFCDYHIEGEFQCSADKCDFTGKTRLQVRTHQYTHRPRKYGCSFAGCTASFKQESHLTIHQRVHTQERPFACEECHKAFPTKGLLTVHQRIHSGLKYHCTWPDCDYSATQRGNVYTHVRTGHFALPASKKAQDELNIIDTRDAGEFIEKNPTN